MEIKSNKQFNKAKGNAGEALACSFLEKQGFEIIEQNYKNKIGEIDIISQKDDVIHFIEVKLRATDSYGLGRESVTRGKQKTIRKAAELYLIDKELYEEVNVCFDVIEISGTVENCDVEFFENCF